MPNERLSREQRVRKAFQELGEAWEIDPMGDRYREADNELDDAISELGEDVTPSGDGQSCGGFLVQEHILHCPGCPDNHLKEDVAV